MWLRFSKIVSYYQITGDTREKVEAVMNRGLIQFFSSEPQRFFTLLFKGMYNVDWLILITHVLSSLFRLKGVHS
jgi:hypothetical protein